MKLIRFILLFCSVFCFSHSIPHARAGEFSIGGGGIWSSSPYKKHDALALPVLVLSYNTEHFYLRGLEAGAYLWKNNLHELSIGLGYSPLAFDSSKTDNGRMEKLDDRHSTVTADITYALHSEYGLLKAKLLRDILGNSDAWSAELLWAYPFAINTVHIRPAIGMHWDSREQTDYYFGVSDKEAQKSGFTAYSPNATVSPYLSLYANWLVSENWRLGVGGKVIFLGSEITNSPMVDTSRVFNGTFSLNYSF